MANCNLNVIVSFALLLVLCSGLEKMVHIEGMKDQYDVNDVVTVKCVGEPGIPEAMDIYFSCGEHNNTKNTMVDGKPVSELSFTATAADNNTNCTCHAGNDQVQSDTFVTIIHVTNNINTGGDDDGIVVAGYVVAIIVAVLGVIAAIIPVVVCKCKKICCFEPKKKEETGRDVKYELANDRDREHEIRHHPETYT